MCSDVRLNVDFDLTLTVLADLLCRSMAERLSCLGMALAETADEDALMDAYDVFCQEVELIVYK